MSRSANLQSRCLFEPLHDGKAAGPAVGEGKRRWGGRSGVTEPSTPPAVGVNRMLRKIGFRRSV